MGSEEETLVVDNEVLYVSQEDKYNNSYDDALKLLSTNIQDYTDNNVCGIVNIVPYSINKRGKYPFVEFILNRSRQFYKEELLSELNFHRFFYMNSIDILENSNKILNDSFFHVTKDNSFDFNKHYKGYTLDESNNSIYLFYDCTEINKDSTVTNLYGLWITLSKEIYNNYSCEMQIDPSVVDFFTNNSYFLYLKDENGKLYDLPDVGFTGSNFKVAEFRSTFGNPSSSKYESVFGMGYYFTDYKTAFEEAVSQKNNTEYGNKKYGGLNRYALFKSSTIYLSYLQSVDTKIDDFSSYDSVYVDKKLTVLKKYEQQIPISYHLVF